MSSPSHLFSRLLVVVVPPGSDRPTRTRILAELEGEIADDVDSGVVIKKWVIDATSAMMLHGPPAAKPENLFVVADYAGHDGTPFATLLEQAMRVARDFRPTDEAKDRSRLLVFTSVHPRHWSADPGTAVRRATRHGGGRDLVPDWCIVERK